MTVRRVRPTPVEVGGEVAKDINDFERLGLGFPPVPEPEVRNSQKRLTIGIEEVIRQAKTPLPWMIEKTLIADTLTMIYGPPKQYKTFLALDMCLSQATGLPFLGKYKILQRGLVIYAAGEGVAGVGQRVLAWCIDRGVEDINARTVPFRRTTGPILIGDGGAAALGEEIEALAKESGLPVTGIYIDTLARNFGSGDENSTKDMNVFVGQCDFHLRQRFKAPVVIVHHTGHDRADRARGSSVLQAAMDGQVRVTCDFPDVFYEPDFMKDAESPPPHVLSVEHIPLGFNDQFGDPVKSVVLRMTDKLPGPKLKLSPDAKLAFDLLSDEAQVFEDWRADFMIEAEKTPIQKGRNKGQKRDNNALRQAWGRAVDSLEKQTLIIVERDNQKRALNACRATDAGL